MPAFRPPALRRLAKGRADSDTSPRFSSAAGTVEPPGKSIQAGPDGRPAAPEPPRNGRPAAPEPPQGEKPTQDTLLGGRIAVGVLAAAVVAATGLTVHQVRTVDAAATTAEIQTARFTLAREIETLRTSMTDPTQDGQAAATELLRQQIATLNGEPADLDYTAQLVDELQTAAAVLAAARTTPLPERPRVLPVAAVDPVFVRLGGLEAQAANVAARFAEAAADAEEIAQPLADLLSAAADYGAAQPPRSTNPSTVASAWRDELERLEAYRTAVEAAAQVPALQPLAEAHGLLVTGMTELAEAALEDLDDGDLDAYNRRLDETLDGDDPFGFATAVADGREQTATTLLQGPLQLARTDALGLLRELEELARVAPAVIPWNI